MLSRRGFLWSASAVIAGGVTALAGCGSSRSMDTEAALGALNSGLRGGSPEAIERLLGASDNSLLLSVCRTRRDCAQFSCEVSAMPGAEPTRQGAAWQLPVRLELSWAEERARGPIRLPMLLTVQGRAKDGPVMRVDVDDRTFSVPWSHGDIRVEESAGVRLLTRASAGPAASVHADILAGANAAREAVPDVGSEPLTIVYWGEECPATLYGNGPAQGGRTLTWDSPDGGQFTRIMIASAPQGALFRDMSLHEGVHALTARWGKGSPPRIVIEGLAVWATARFVDGFLAKARDLPHVPEAIADIERGLVESAGYEGLGSLKTYWQAGALMAWAESRHGRAAVWEMGRRCYEGKRFEDVFLAPLGHRSLKDAGGEWGAWLRAAIG